MATPGHEPFHAAIDKEGIQATLDLFWAYGNGLRFRLSLLLLESVNQIKRRYDEVPFSLRGGSCDLSHGRNSYKYSGSRLSFEVAYHPNNQKDSSHLNFEAKSR